MLLSQAGDAAFADHERLWLWVTAQGRDDNAASSFLPARSPLHSITSSARASSVGGMSMPSALAVLRFTTSSNLVGCSTGRSAGFAPLKILSTKAADRRCKSRKLTP